MSDTVPTITLTGTGATGLLPQAKPKGIPLKPLTLSRTVKLGRIPCEVRDDCPRFAAVYAPPSGWKPPDAVDYTEKAHASLETMLGNDTWGDCVLAGKAHSVGVWTGNDSDSGGEVIPTTGECVEQYHDICGPGDRGCVIQDVLSVMKRDGLMFGGKRHTLDGWVAVDHTKPDHVRAATYLFGAVTLGINFPGSWANSSTWDVTSSRVVGGHDVPIIRYDQRGVYVSSWGRVYLMTWAALAQRGRVDECYALLAPDWYNDDRLSPAGVDVDNLRAALAALGSGNMPPDPTPVPPHPPTPPPPPAPPTPWAWPVFDIELEDTAGGMRGTITARAPAPPDAEDEHGWPFRADQLEFADVVADALHRVKGITVHVVGGRLIVRRDGLTPEQWQAIVALLLELLPIIFGP